MPTNQSYQTLLHIPSPHSLTGYFPSLRIHFLLLTTFYFKNVELPDHLYQRILLYIL